MKTAAAALAVMMAPAGATQIVYMDLDEVLPMAGCVLTAEVVSVEAFEGEDWCSGDFSLIALETLRGEAQTGAEISCTYHLNLPRICESAGGTVAWVSQDETGSGHEFLVSNGDTVVVLLESGCADTAGTLTLLRIEPLEMLDVIRGKINNASRGGAGLSRIDQAIREGGVYTMVF
ncbi:MAG: hypothetical protein JXR55_09070, partial [Candidatus Fermentibacteraceae bacterium]|nr:hypothetical protein [Candidatus Fermentibacteraceae bacterium]